ncbi:hypothetical protein [Tenacibaculum mesophilum]|uniref:Abnormal spindle-like microcephaly-associated protein ASH domain-containing protein n=1 Tax=Tenacibaculum mesophilum TaxID=104268 RepID=A0AAE9MLU0_9FLAO|nr:hypothetical protein [Tenacibaculum mesophilum]AZJ31759.1 hypothetical protein D6200_03930 [Tenacibaculum mesophilum]QFS27013.1 hypothetical protein F9Y86_00795 [Tenacibaculum mesophilum]UTD14434.1 hypothetical protein HER15_02640 [Tenacibaculum mesophilum]SHG04097.1 Abnormal spindle-like microcephaly-assoc'd, ASPM-SPD-2-Hydin [Tenacibaculum mesophilum]
MKKTKLVIALFILSKLLIQCSSNEPVPEVEVDPEPEELKEVKLSIKLPDDYETLNFKDLVIGNEKTLPISIFNEGNLTLEITEVILPEGFSVNLETIKIPPSDFFELDILFKPTEEKKYSGNITFTSNVTEPYNNTILEGLGVNDTFEGDVDFKTQKELIDFIGKGYKNINGTLGIGSPYDGANHPVTDLKLLKSLNSAKRLSVWGAQVTSLEGLENIKGIETIQIALNNNLTSLNGFPKNNSSALINIVQNENLIDIKALAGIEIIDWLRVHRNPKLESLTGLENLKEIKRDLEISGNYVITNLDSFSNLERVGGNISIQENNALYSYCGLVNLMKLGGLEGTFYLPRRNRFNPSWVDELDCERQVPFNEYHGVQTWIDDRYDLDYFKQKGFTKISGEVYINDSDITTLTALSNIEEIEHLYIQRTNLESLEGLDNLRKVKSLYIEYNDKLSNFCSLGSLTIEGSSRIENNLYNPTVTDLANENCKQ